MAAAAVAAAAAASAFLSGLKLHRVLILISDRMEHRAVGRPENLGVPVVMLWAYLLLLVEKGRGGGGGGGGLGE